MNLEKKRVLVVGMARSGIAAAELLLRHGAIPVLSDMKLEEAFGDQLDSLRNTACVFRLGEDSVKLLDEADILMISPGVPIDAPVVKAAKEKGIPVVGELELASSLLNGDMLAISGTNGKTTTTTLLGKIFENAGRITHVAGNIGYPLSDHRTVDLRAAEQRPPFARVGIYQDFHYKIIFSSERTRMSSAPIVLSCSILLHNSRSLITTWIELQPS